MPIKRLIYHGLVLIGFTVYVVSLFSPLVTVNKLLFLSDTVSLVSIISTLMENGEIFLGTIVFVFTIVLPLLKFLLLGLYGLNPDIDRPLNKLYQILEHISKWAMLDVFIAAILIVVIKLELLSSALTHYGLYLFIFSVVLSMFCSQSRRFWLSRVNARASG